MKKWYGHEKTQFLLGYQAWISEIAMSPVYPFFSSGGARQWHFPLRKKEGFMHRLQWFERHPASLSVFLVVFFQHVFVHSRSAPTLPIHLSLSVPRTRTASVAESMGGTMGGVLQIFFSAGDAALSSPTPAVKEGGGGAWCQAFVAGVEGVEFYGGAKAGMRTVLDAVVPAADVLRTKGLSGMYAVVFFLDEG